MNEKPHNHEKTTSSVLCVLLLIYVLHGQRTVKNALLCKVPIRSQIRLHKIRRFYRFFLIKYCFIYLNTNRKDHKKVRKSERKIDHLANL